MSAVVSGVHSIFQSVGASLFTTSLKASYIISVLASRDQEFCLLCMFRVLRDVSIFHTSVQNSGFPSKCRPAALQYLTCTGLSLNLIRTYQPFSRFGSTPFDFNPNFSIHEVKPEVGRDWRESSEEKSSIATDDVYGGQFQLNAPNAARTPPTVVSVHVRGLISYAAL